MEQIGDKNSTLEDAINHLFECINDKDEHVRNAIEGSLIKIVEKRPDEALLVITDYRSKHSKLNEQAMSMLLRVIESVVKSADIKRDTLEKVISLVIDELTRSNDHSPGIQTPALEALVAIGRHHCDMVMEALINHTKEGAVTHFMIMHCMGTLAVTNVPGSTPYIKTILGTLLPNLGSIKLDHVKQAHAFAIGKFCEALLETGTDTALSPDIDQSCTTEISVAYDVFLNQWLHNREPKVCVDILQALSSMYPLLPVDKIQDQTSKLIATIMSLNRRSIDRNSVTQFLASVLKTNVHVQPSSLDHIADALITSLFDLVCVYPDYEKPQTVKGHYEVLRCFHLLAEIYAGKIMEMLLIHLKNNNERERIKALLVLAHLTNTSCEFIGPNLEGDVLNVLKQMILIEKSIKMKCTLLKTIVALAQKSYIKEKEFVWFIMRYSCKYSKPNSEHGTAEDYNNFMQTCQKSLFMLSSTVGTMDELLKRELLNYFVLLDYSDVCSIIMKCLGSLFAKNSQIEFECNPTGGGDEDENKSKLYVPSPEAIYARCITLMGNYKEVERISNILLFLKYYYPNISADLDEKWEQKISELLICNGKDDKEKLFLDNLLEFITQTIECIKDNSFADKLIEKLTEHFVLYPVQLPPHEFTIPTLTVERGMLLKTLGLSLCHISDVQIIEAKIDLIINIAKHEKLDKHAPNSDFEHKLVDASKALGYTSRRHLNIVLKKLQALALLGVRKSHGGFFSNLHFIKDSAKESENYKINLLVFEAYGHMIENANASESLREIDDTMINFLLRQLTDTKDQTMKKVILNTLLNICNQFIKSKDLRCELKSRNEILKQILAIPIEHPFDNLPLFPNILKLATILIKIESDETMAFSSLLDLSSRNLFCCAQNLKAKFDSHEEDERNSFLAQYINLSLPELNHFVKVIIESDPSPACLDDVISIVECWIKDNNSEVRICAGHVINSALEVYIKSMKIGCEAPSKFNQTGQMLGKIVPRCIDSNATVRQTSVDILQKVLEISNIYETLTIADNSVDWVKDMERVRDDIITDDPKEIYKLAGEIARIIALRVSNFQYLQFCKTLLFCLNDPEHSSAIGASVVLKFFVQQKGAELFHAIPELVKDSLEAVSHCDIARAKTGVIKALVALTKHHPKLVCSEMLAQPIPFDDSVIEYWQTICIDLELIGTILDNFLGILSASCLYEPSDVKDDRQKIATAQPFTIFCALKEIFLCQDIKTELKHKFPELFTMLLTSLATYTNLAPPMLTSKQSSNNKTQGSNGKTKYGFVPNKDAVKLIPCQIVLDTFKAFLNNLEMEQIETVLSVCPQLALSTDLLNFIDILTPMAVGIVNQFTISSSVMKQIVTALSKYVASPYDGQRIASIGLYSQLVPLKPSGEISSVIMLHLSSALSDPNAVVRGLCIRGLAFVGNLTEHDIDKYSETAITSLLKGIDDYNSECLINIPLESKRGLSRILQSLPSDRVESFHISLAIRIRPFFENPSTEIREAAILLFGDLCESKMESLSDGSLSPMCSSEALREQLFANFFSLLLHLSETDVVIVRACKVTLRKVCALMNAPKVNEMAQKHLLEHGQLNYSVFVVDFVKLIGDELSEHVQDFIESCIPFLKSHWAEIRGNAAVIIGILHNFLQVHNQHAKAVGHKLAILLKDEQASVRLKAALALGYFFGDI